MVELAWLYQHCLCQSLPQVTMKRVLVCPFWRNWPLELATLCFLNSTSMPEIVGRCRDACSRQMIWRGGFTLWNRGVPETEKRISLKEEALNAQRSFQMGNKVLCRLESIRKSNKVIIPPASPSVDETKTQSWPEYPRDLSKKRSVLPTSM